VTRRQSRSGEGGVSGRCNAIIGGDNKLQERMGGKKKGWRRVGVIVFTLVGRAKRFGKSGEKVEKKKVKEKKKLEMGTWMWKSLFKGARIP